MNFMCKSAEIAPLVSRDCVTETFAKILHDAKADWADETLKEASGVPVRLIRSYRNECKEPGLGKALSILAALGQSDLNLVLATIGYVAHPLDEAGEVGCAGTLVASSMASLSTLASAAADGRFDHTELPACRQAADALIETVLPLSSVGAAA